jgi:Flp pilus assembly protein TadG
MPRWRRWADDDGSASLEFVTAGMVLLLPLVYLVLTVSSVQAGALAVEGAARQAARVFVQADTAQEAREQARRAIDFALADYGIDSRNASVSVRCGPHPSTCLTRLGTVTVTIAVSVSLPLLPSAIAGDFPVRVPLQASASQQVSRFWGAR